MQIILMAEKNLPRPKNTARAEMKTIVVLPETMSAHLLKQLEKQVCTLS